jgi:hypothetical protein
MSGFLLFFIVIVSPHQRDTIGVVKVPLDSFKSRKSKPPDETAYILKFVVGFQDQKDLCTVWDNNKQVAWLVRGSWRHPLAGEDGRVMVRLPDWHIIQKTQVEGTQESRRYFCFVVMVHCNKVRYPLYKFIQIHLRTPLLGLLLIILRGNLFE